ncbi:putative quinol monooxygenase [Shewanella sp. 6_MG-2023]|uniref:putative quinol monooxygenase n=1 Tax=Shewanella sp. 6_MG-2023 TaxID=3062660 RepID=UPI0026E412D2|nr:putative quinol monooxygenase [Shewanella sp. 6_MG-2023]MDO6618877.1 putative quinol monooxygenase [Shewanella sp. 6_MG-2023]
MSNAISNSMNKVSLTGYILVPEAELKAVTEALKVHSQLTKQEPGCLSFSVTQDASNPVKFYVSETFKNQQAFDHHQQRTSHSNWALVSKNVSRHYQFNSLIKD